jgi:hypothetical protein
MKTIKITVPDELADEAIKAGLFQHPQLERMLQEGLRRAKAVEVLDGLWSKVEKYPEPSMSMDEITAEVKAYRAERRRATGS